MSLLQIFDPLADNTKKTYRFGVGIDLGTTNSLIAAVNRDGDIRIAPTGEGRDIIPSVVAYLPDNKVIVGEAAKNHAGHIASAKRLIGRGIDDITDDFNHHRIDRANSNASEIVVDTATGPRSPVEVSADILKYLISLAPALSEESVAGAVITVPAYFDHGQRQATRNAAMIADIPVLRLLNEPTAAAIAYGLDNEKDGACYLVFDLGGGTFDVSVLRMTRGLFEVIATGGDSALGGNDFDAALAKLLLDGKDISPDSGVLQAARGAKETLTEQEEVNVVFEHRQDIDPISVTRAQFNQATESLVERAIAITRDIVESIDIAVESIILVGGATRLPSIRAALTDAFGLPILCSHDPDRVVAMGAAIQADMLCGNKRQEDWLLLDIIPLSLGIETMGGLNERIIQRNSTIPISKERVFTTHQEGQRAISLHVIQGERELVTDCRSLAKFTLQIPPMPVGTPRVHVLFQVDADGVLTVAASEKISGASIEVMVKPSYGLSEHDIAQMIETAHAQADADSDARALQQARAEAETLINHVNGALAADAELLSGEEKQAIEQTIEALRDSLSDADAGAINGYIKQLGERTEEFAQRRMRQAFMKTLSGKHITAVDNTIE